jgi:hypothetical protein
LLSTLNKKTNFEQNFGQKVSAPDATGVLVGKIEEPLNLKSFRFGPVDPKIPDFYVYKQFFF